MVSTKLTRLSSVAVLLGVQCVAVIAASAAQSAVGDSPPPDDAVPAPSNSKPGSPSNVVIKSKRYLFNRATHYAHSLPEVDGATITVTKKTTVSRLVDQ